MFILISLSLSLSSCFALFIHIRFKFIRFHSLLFNFQLSRCLLFLKHSISFNFPVLFPLLGCPSCNASRELDIPHPPAIKECQGVSSKHFYVTLHNCIATSTFPRDFTCASHLRDSGHIRQAMQVKLSACVPCVVCHLLHRPTSTEPKRNYLEVALRFLKAWRFRQSGARPPPLVHFASSCSSFPRRAISPLLVS